MSVGLRGNDVFDVFFGKLNWLPFPPPSPTLYGPSGDIEVGEEVQVIL